MASKGGKYENYKNENFVEYLVAIGTPEDKAKQADAAKSTLEISVNGKNVKLVSDIGGHKNESNLVIGEEVEETLHNSSVKSTTSATDDTLTVVTKGARGSGSRTYKFSGSELLVTFSSDNAPTAKRYYKILK